MRWPPWLSTAPQEFGGPAVSFGCVLHAGVFVAAIPVDRRQLVGAVNFVSGNLRWLFVVLLFLALFAGPDFLQALDQGLLDQGFALGSETLPGFRILGA